jgi:glycosyltransferase involved in cell wall biosynthesis
MNEHPHVLSVLIPAFNEERTIIPVLRKVLALGSLLKEIIVVDDGSRDRTPELVQDFAARYPLIRFCRLLNNSGKTAAIQHALDMATGEIIIVQDADLECDPAEIPAVVAPILAGQADVVYGSRFLVRQAGRVLYFSHYVANTALTFFSNLLTNRNMTDIETCYKAFRAGVIKPLRLTSRGFGMEVEITAMVTKSRARTYEVPISYQSRSYEEGKKIGVSDGVMAGVYILYYNLVAPRLPKGRRYVAEVNGFLATEHYTHAPAIVATAGTAASA